MAEGFKRGGKLVASTLTLVKDDGSVQGTVSVPVSPVDDGKAGPKAFKPGERVLTERVLTVRDDGSVVGGLGPNDQVLTLKDGLPTWSPATGGGGGMTNPMTTKGDVIVSADGAGTPARLAVGANTQVLTADSTATNGVKWAAPGAASTPLEEQILDYFAAHPSGNLDVLLSIGAYRVFIFFTNAATSGWRTPTNATYTVPGGKTLYVLKIWGTAILDDSGSRQARLRNTTDSTDLIAPGNFDSNSVNYNPIPWTGDAGTAALPSAAATKVVDLELWNTTAVGRAMGAVVVCKEI